MEYLAEKSWSKYFRDIEPKNDTIIGIEFRHKYYHRKRWNSKYAQNIYKSGKRKKVDYESSGFLRVFYNGLFSRPSCSICPYAKQERVSDLTIGDAWGVEKIKSDLNPHQGVFLFSANTPKGK